MTIKAIAVTLDDHPANSLRTAYAANLALDHEARLVGIYRLPLNHRTDAAASFARGQEAIRQTIRFRAEDENTVSARGRRSFETAVSKIGVEHEFKTHRYYDNQFEVEALHADLVICASPERRSSEFPPADASQLALGVPFLLLPSGWKDTTAPRNILIGWNGSREARRAIGDSLPILRAAGSVTILIVKPDVREPDDGASGSEIVAFLSRHGVYAEIQTTFAGSAGVAYTLLNFGIRLGCDLLILGAYSHSRYRELFFGGVTRALLLGSSIPLLISH
jgi:nucleotide-binding universal stress UspA family protein